MGKVGQSAVRLVTSMPMSAGVDEIQILCPFLRGLDPALGMWLGPLAWHDSNAALLAVLEQARPLPPQVTVFAGVFCADPFRAEDDVVAALRAAGVSGMANLPSVSFLDGEFGQTLAALNLGMARELNFLRHARSHGFRIAGCASALSDAQSLCAFGAELIITHAGPPHTAQADLGLNRDGQLAQQLSDCGAQLVSLSELIVQLGAAAG